MNGISLVQGITLLATIVTAGWFAAFLTQLVKREQWSSGVKWALGIVVAALVGLATAWLTGDVTKFITLWQHGTVTADQVIVLGTLIYTAGQAWYYAVYVKAGWAQSVARVGSKK